MSMGLKLKVHLSGCLQYSCYILTICMLTDECYLLVKVHVHRFDANVFFSKTRNLPFLFFFSSFITVYIYIFFIVFIIIIATVFNCIKLYV